VRESFEDLVLRIADGSETAVWELLDRYSTNILRLVRRHLPAEIRPKVDSVDIVQSVWKSLLRKGIPVEQLRTAEDFVAYLAGTAKLKVFEAHRHYTRCQSANVRREVHLDFIPADEPQRKRFPLTFSHDPRADKRSSTPSAIVCARENWERAIDRAGERGQQVVQLKLQGHTLDEIAERLSLSKSTVRRVLDSLLQSLTA
jgi:RNA polymerase sigma-70 factor (ECF subfamily)